MNILDSLFANNVARNCELNLFDYTGYEHSEGTILETLHEAGLVIVEFLSTIGVPKVNILGFCTGSIVV